MIIAKFMASHATTAYGLTQWDYGQKLTVWYEEREIPDGTEVQFYQRNLSSVAYIQNNCVDIPDQMLTYPDEMIAYVYVRSQTSGETILTIHLPIQPRQQPKNYVLPEYREYLRLLPQGGRAGQVLVKKSETDFDVGWEDVSASGGDGIEPISKPEIDTIIRKE